MKKAEVDQHMADELLLYADNESSLYNQRKSIEENLSKKINDGKFDLKLSAKLWRYWIDDAAKRYSREFPGTRFGVPERNAAAAAMAQRFATDWSTDQVAQFSPDGPAWHLVRKGISSGWEATTPDRLGGKAILSVFSGKTPYRKVIVELKKLSRKLTKSWGHFEKIEEGLCETFRKIDRKSSAPLRAKAIKLFRQLPLSLKNQYEAQMHLRTTPPGKVAKASKSSGVKSGQEMPCIGIDVPHKRGDPAWVVEWQTGAMGGPGFWYYQTEEQARKCAASVIANGSRAEVRYAEKVYADTVFGLPVSGKVVLGERAAGRTRGPAWRVSGGTPIEGIPALLTGHELHRALVDAGVPIDNHESDLYVKVTPESTKLIDRYVYKAQVKSFINNNDQQRWYDVPFAYQPFWEKKQGARKAAESVSAKRQELVHPPGSPPGPSSGFGKETTADDFKKRVEWERWAADRARAEGHGAMADGHDLARVEYEKLAARKGFEL